MRATGRRVTTLLQVHDQNRYGRGCHARQATGHSDGRGPHLRKLLTHLVRKTADLRVIEILGQQRLFVTAMALDFRLLTLDVTGVLRANLHLRPDLAREAIIGLLQDGTYGAAVARIAAEDPALADQ